jgi:5-methylcytosine-specific restriction endonuclease McrA
MTKVCLKCSKPLNELIRRQLFCGSKKEKGSCSHLHALEYNKEWRVKKRSDPIFLKNEDRRRRKWRELNPGLTDSQRIAKKKRRLKLRFEILQRDNFTCQYCGRKAPEVVLHLDHIFPQSKGGKSKPENLITSCLECNIGKQDIVLNEFI